MSIAYLDESQPGGTGSGRPFILAATIPYSDVDIDTLRQKLRVVRPPKQRKLHWYESVESARTKFISLISSFEVMHWVVVRENTAGEDPERSRRACIEFLIYELQEIGITDAVFESRGPADDRRDVNMLGHLRANKTINARFRFHHVRGIDEPLLWIPDIVCGAVCADLEGRRHHLRALRQQTEIMRTNRGYRQERVDGIGV